MAPYSDCSTTTTLQRRCIIEVEDYNANIEETTKSRSKQSNGRPLAGVWEFFGYDKEESKNVVPNVPYKTVALPSNYGGWVLCATEPTTNADTECGANGYACYAVDTVAKGPSTKVCIIIINPTQNNLILNVVATFTAESPFISNDLNSNPSFSNFAVLDTPLNETITLDYKSYITTAQLSKRYYRD
ncbi:569_t:CDS:2 [Entrophospora sp. SA101]|nr:569_t:CDS:2 [Entrophospora sp. SA101]